ncbi:serine/threonine protein kinase [Polyangium spumosum]|uniref:Stress response kinase A n=1 Tax=Polyangium spumosum TaxID=889282 RepID=A0A6N7PNM0_9BACT|nr:serine/threonine protein kinase [Polyangium spumosum]MRG93628.1 serine/threonine protein kinase [Polyangium spumosum]
MNTTDLFLSLTPHKVLEAVEDAGFSVNPLCYPLNSFENRVYEVELEDRSRLVAKFYRPGRWSPAQILEEHLFLADLAEAEVPVCLPRTLRGGGTLGAVDGISYCLFPRMGGRAPDEPDLDLLQRLGMLAARIHNVGAARPAAHRVRLDADVFVRQNVAFLREKAFVPQRLLPRYERAARVIADFVDEGIAATPVHRIHGDLHLGNLLLRDGVLSVVDFDDMVVGPAVQDLWLLLPGQGVEARIALESFLEGYETLRAFDRKSLRLATPLRGLRRVHYAAWIARRFHDPIFPRTFPHFGTEAYWEEETRDLEQILQMIAGERGGFEA